jgi:hypothetical protein
MPIALARKRVSERLVVEADLHHAHRRTHPEGVRRVLDRQCAYIDAGPHLESLGHFIRWFADARLLLAATGAEQRK